MRSFVVRSSDIDRCPDRNLSPRHWRDDPDRGIVCLHEIPGGSMNVNVYDDDDLAEVLDQIVAPPVVKLLREQVASGLHPNLRAATASLLETGWAAMIAVQIRERG